MTAADDKSRENPAGRDDKLHPDKDKKEEGCNEVPAPEKNPDVEDPRLYSPLQEPDRPSQSERASEGQESPRENQ